MPKRTLKKSAGPGDAREIAAATKVQTDSWAEALADKAIHLQAEIEDLKTERDALAARVLEMEAGVDLQAVKDLVDVVKDQKASIDRLGIQVQVLKSWVREAQKTGIVNFKTAAEVLGG